METYASILINGVRQKMYMTNSIFLADNTEFEIEFYNKSIKTVCPSITINGEALSSSPVIYNGQKYVLKDFISINKKFLFTTYKVDNSEDSLNAIKENGIIDIKYFYEKQLSDYNDIRFSAKQKIHEDSLLADDLPCTDDIIGKQEIETGKITKGSTSNIQYKTINIDLDLSFFEHQIIKLLPLSAKPINQVCPECSHNSSINDNFCSNCSHQYN